MSREEKILTFKVFAWTVGTLISVWACAYGYTWTRLSTAEAKAEIATNKYVNTQETLGAIKTDVEWIKATLQGKYK